MQLASHHVSLTADETAWQSCTPGAEKPLAEHRRKADAKVALILRSPVAGTARSRSSVPRRNRRSASTRPREPSKGMPAAANGMPAVPRARIVFKMTICLVGLCVCGLLYGVQGNPMWLPVAFYAVAWWALGFAAPSPARLPSRIALWSAFASCYLVGNSWLLVPVVGVLLDLTCRLLWRTLPGLIAAEAAARAPEQSAFDNPSPMPHRKRTPALPREKTA